MWEKNTVPTGNLRSFTISHSQTNRLYGDGTENEEIDEEEDVDDGKDSVKAQSTIKRKRSGDDEDDGDDDGDIDDDGRPSWKQ